MKIDAMNSDVKIDALCSSSFALGTQNFSMGGFRSGCKSEITILLTGFAMGSMLVP